MEILQLDKPDTCYDRSVDSKYVSVPREEELLDHSGAGNIHECSFHDIFLLCRRVSGTSTKVAYPVGIILAAAFLGIFIHATKKPMKA